MDAYDLTAGKRPFGPGRKCLFGVTILVVEDSRSASDAVQLLGSALGGRMRRAQSIETAERHLAAYRPNVVMVDLGLPDGSGLTLLRRIAETAPPVPGLVAFSGADADDWAAAARAAGANALLAKPIAGIEAFANAILSVLPDGADRRAGKVPEVSVTEPDAASLAADLTGIRDQLFEALTVGDRTGISYCGQFLESLAQQTGDAALAEAVGPLTLAIDDAAVQTAGARLLVRLSHRLGDPVADGPVAKAVG